MIEPLIRKPSMIPKLSDYKSFQVGREWTFKIEIYR